MNKIIITAFLLTTVVGFAQKNELGKVTIEQLKEKRCPSDTAAAASVLFSIGKSYLLYSNSKGGFELVTEKIAKIKIYKKEGYEYANQSMTYYIGGSSDERIDVSKAATYNLVNGKIEKTKLSSDGEFTEKINKFWSRKKITLPNVKEGSIIEFKFEVVSSYIDISPWQFQTDIPTVYSEFTTNIPEYYIFNTRLKGYLTPKVQEEILSKTEGQHTSATTSSSNSFTYNETKTTYSLENIPALKEESFVNNINNYRAAISFELSGKRFPNRPYENFTTDWETVVKSIYKSSDFGDELKKTGYFEKDIDVLLSGVNAQEERMALIFSYVKSRMNWNEYYGFYCNEGVKKAYQDKTGNVAEINLMLTAMLRHAGFEANPVIISTRSNGISLFPSRNAYNYVIAGVELNNEVILMDATNKFSTPNVLPIRDLNWFGRIIRKNESSAEIDLMPRINSKDIVNVMATIDDKGEVSGKIRDQYFDYNAFLFRQNNNGVSKESYIEKLEKKHQGLEVGEYSVQNSAELNLPIVENYDFKSTNSVEIIGDKMYLSPFMFLAMTENPFKQETREYPVDFVFPNHDKFNISLKIPEGYGVEVLPAAKVVSMPDNLASFKYNISNNGNQIQLMYTLDTNQAIIGSEYYEELKAFYKEIVAKQTEKVVLKKV
ncbi:transglutaminase domain-containing protein [Flavobacterium sp.]